MLDRARRIIDSCLVWDNHACMPLRPDDHTFLPQMDRFSKVGVDVVSINVGFGPQTLDAHLRMLTDFRLWFSARDDRYVLVDSVADIDRAKADCKLAIQFDIEGMAIFDSGDTGLVHVLRNLGVRWISIAYNRNNAVGGGCYDDDPGLSSFGRDVLEEMKSTGVIVCCSHTGHRTAFDVLEHAGNPVIFSHSNAAAVYPHARNIPDELIRGCAATGGVVGINGIGAFLGDNDNRPETLVRHIDHVVSLVGPDHVGIALDYVFDQQELLEYLATMPETFPDVANLQEPKMIAPEGLGALVEELCRLGYSNADIAKVLGGNWRRVAQAVWK